MEIRYSREMNHNYMIIEAPEEETGYAVQMLSANAIEGLLKFRVRQTEEAREYYYEITSRQPLRRVLEKRTLSGQELRSILLGVLAVLKRVEEYLLKEEQLLLIRNICIWNPIILLWNYVWFRGIGKRRRRRSQNCWGIFWNVRIIRIGRLLY